MDSIGSVSPVNADFTTEYITVAAYVGSISYIFSFDSYLNPVNRRNLNLMSYKEDLMDPLHNDRQGNAK